MNWDNCRKKIIKKSLKIYCNIIINVDNEQIIMKINKEKKM